MRNENDGALASQEELASFKLCWYQHAFEFATGLQWAAISGRTSSGSANGDVGDALVADGTKNALRGLGMWKDKLTKLKPRDCSFTRYRRCDEGLSLAWLCGAFELLAQQGGHRPSIDKFGLVTAVHDINISVWEPSRDGGSVPYTNTSTQGLFVSEIDRPFIHLLYNSEQFNGACSFRTEIQLRAGGSRGGPSLEVVDIDRFDYLVVSDSVEEKIRDLLKGGSSMQAGAGSSPAIGQGPLAPLVARGGERVDANLIGEKVPTHSLDTGRPRNPRARKAPGSNVVAHMASIAEPSNFTSCSPLFTSPDGAEPRGFDGVGISGIKGELDWNIKIVAFR